MIQFGTGGWRAVIGDEFTKANVQLLTHALARKMQAEGKAEAGFVIGYDRRFLSEEAAKWAAEVMAGCGIPCAIIHRESPTPLIMYTVMKLGLPYGMAVTASHNPAIYNGIKVFMEGGRDADERLTSTFEGYIRELMGEPIPLARVPEWAGLEPKITIQNVDRLLLGYFKMPLANNVEPGSPLGVSGYSRAVDLIHQADEQWRRILWEYEGTELAVHADETLFRADSMGRRLLPDGHERLYRLVPGLENKMEVFSPAIRDEPLFNGFNNMLKRIEFQCGLAYGTLSDPQNVDKTAEEIRASKQRSFAQVRDIQKALQTALDDLVYAMDVWATLGGLAPAGAYQTAYSWDDSIVNDPGERKKLFWAYVQEGKFPFARYLQEFEGYGEDEAAAIVAAAAAESGTDEPLAFGAG